MIPQMRHCVSYFAIALVFVLMGCSFGSNQSTDEQRRRDEKTREEIAKATEHAKPEIEAAGRALGRAAQAAAEEAKAAGQGLREGWKEGHHEPLDLNAATEKELNELPGVSATEARKIIRHRPYRNKQELLTKGLLSEEKYAAIRDDVTVR